MNLRTIKPYVPYVICDTCERDCTRLGSPIFYSKTNNYFCDTNCFYEKHPELFLNFNKMNEAGAYI